MLGIQIPKMENSKTPMQTCVQIGLMSSLLQEKEPKATQQGVNSEHGRVNGRETEVRGGKWAGIQKRH